MARRQKVTSLAQAINLCSQLSADDQQTIADLIRLKRDEGKSRNGTAPAAVKAATPRKGKVNTPAMQLAVDTSRTVEDAQEALKANGGDKKAAMLALTGGDQ